MTNHIVKAGKLLLVDSGSYSNYSIMGFFVTLKDFCPQDELTEYLAQNFDNYFIEDKFLAFLLAKGLLLEIEHGHLYLDGNGSYENYRFIPTVTLRQ